MKSILNIRAKEIYNYLYDNEIKKFNLRDIKKEFPQFNVNTSLEVLAKEGFIERVEKGKYVIKNFRDSEVLGTWVSNGGAISYFTALHYHNLTLQLPKTIYVQTIKQKSNASYFGVPFYFVKLNIKKIFGLQHSQSQGEEFLITDKEKTILDCFDLPQYSGGYFDLIRGLKENDFNIEKLTEYASKMDNRSLLKRIGFLLEYFKKDNYMVFKNKNLKLINDKYNLLDPFGKNEGRFINEWKLRINIPENILLNL